MAGTGVQKLITGSIEVSNKEEIGGAVLRPHRRRLKHPAGPRPHHPPQCCRPLMKLHLHHHQTPGRNPHVKARAHSHPSRSLLYVLVSAVVTKCCGLLSVKGKVRGSTFPATGRYSHHYLRWPPVAATPFPVPLWLPADEQRKM